MLLELAGTLGESVQVIDDFVYGFHVLSSCALDGGVDERVYVGEHRRQVTPSIDDGIGFVKVFFHAVLARQTITNLRFGTPALREQAPHAFIAIALQCDGEVDGERHRDLQEQCGVDHGHGCPQPTRARHLGFAASHHRRVHDRIECLQVPLAREHDATQAPAIDATLRIEHLGAEFVSNRTTHRVLVENRVRDTIAVDVHRAIPIDQVGGDGRFSGARSARESTTIRVRAMELVRLQPVGTGTHVDFERHHEGQRVLHRRAHHPLRAL